MVQYKFYPNTIAESEIQNLLNTISEINTYGYIIFNYLRQENFEIIFTNEDSMFKEDVFIKDMVTRRAYCTDSKIVIHYTRYENIESIKWLFLHELGHKILKNYLSVAALMYFVREDYYKNNLKIFNREQNFFSEAPEFYNKYREDSIHENDPEEILVSQFATNLIGNDYSRDWWRLNQFEF